MAVGAGLISHLDDPFFHAPCYPVVAQGVYGIGEGYLVHSAFEHRKSLTHLSRQITQHKKNKLN